MFNSYASHYQRVDGLEASIVKAWHRPRCGTTVTKTLHRFMKGTPLRPELEDPNDASDLDEREAGSSPSCFFWSCHTNWERFKAGTSPFRKVFRLMVEVGKPILVWFFQCKKLYVCSNNGAGHLRGSRLSSLFKHFLGGNWKGSKTKL